MRQLEQFAKRFSTRCLAFFVKDLPLELKPWGEAMLAEMPQARGILAPVSWAMGGSMVLSKALVRRWFRGKAQQSTSASAGGANSPSPWQRAALVMLLLSFAMGLSPNFRQALATSLESWVPAWAPEGVPAKQLVQKAEKRGDPESLAFAALNTGDLARAEQLAEQAVKGDPRLEWVWYGLLREQVSLVRPTMDLRGTAVSLRIARLEALDPENSAPHLLEADVILRNKPGFRWDSRSLTESVRRDPAWRAAMEQAFAAPTYDTYFNRQLQLETSVLLSLRPRTTGAPLAVINSTFVRAIPEWFSSVGPSARQYSRLLLKEGDDALSKGDLKQASERYWEAAHFAERLRAQAATAWDHVSGSKLQRDSYQKLSVLLAREHQDAEKARIDQTFASLQDELSKLTKPRNFWELVFGPVSATAIAVSVSSAIAFLALALSLVGMGYFFLRQWLRFPAPRLLDSLLTTAGRLAPFALAASCVCLYFTYLPYARLYESFYAGYLNGTLSPEESGQLKSLMQIRYLPDRVISFFGGERGLLIWFWGAITVVLTLAVIAFVWRWIHHRRGTLQTR